MKYQASIQVMPLKNLLDPQGKAVNLTLHHMGMDAIDGVRIGKNITLQVQADSREEAENIIKTACEKILHNPVMEEYIYEIEDV